MDFIRHRQGVIHALTPNQGNKRWLKGAHFARRGGSTPLVTPIWERDFSTPSLGADATFTRASTAYHTQPDGRLEAGKAHEARFAGARRVQNWFANVYSNLGAAVGATVEYGIADPQGGTKAVRLTATGTTFYLRMSPVVVAGLQYVNSFWMRRVAGVGNIKLYYPNSSVATGAVVSVDSTWRRYSTTAVAANTTGYTGPNVAGATIGVDVIEIYFPQIELGSVPSEFVTVGIPTSEELCPNGGFDTDTVWTKGTGWTISGGVAVATASTSNLEMPVEQLPIALGAAYEVVWTVTVTSGTVRLYLGGIASTLVSVSGTYTVVVTATTAGPLYFDAATSFTGTIDDVLVARCDHGANVDGVKYFGTANGNSVDAGSVVTEAPGAALTGPFTLLREPVMTNHLLNSAAPVTQTTGSLTTGTYTLWVEGTGSALASAGTATITGAAAASAGSPDTFEVTVAGTVTVTVTGTLTKFQLEKSAVPTSFILTAGAEATRAVDGLVYSGVAADNEARIDMVPDPDVDLTDWNGTMPTPTVPINEASVKVYNPGERP